MFGGIVNDFYCISQKWAAVARVKVSVTLQKTVIKSSKSQQETCNRIVEDQTVVKMIKKINQNN